MPPPRVAAFAQEPVLTVPARKSLGGLSGSAGLFPGWGLWPSATGQPVSPYAAMASSTVYGCVKRLSEDIGKLPIVVRRRRRGGGFRIDHDHPLNALLRRPNRWQSPFQCWAYLVFALALRGNGYAIVLRDKAGRPLEIVPNSPDSTTPMIGASGDLFYQVSNRGLFRDETKTLHMEEMVHAKGLTFDGLIGVSPIGCGQTVVGLALATQDHGATLFRQGAQLGGVLTHPKTLSPEARSAIGTSWDRNFSGVTNAHKTAVLDEGMKFEKMSMTNEDAQFLESRKLSSVEICRLFGVPPHKVQDLSNAHFNNLEQSEQQYVNDTLLPIGKQLEEQLERTLLFEDEFQDIEIRFNFDGLLRADRKTRYETYAVGIGNGMLNRNEARIDDGREPVDGQGLDDFLQPLNMTTPANTAPTEATDTPAAPAQDDDAPDADGT